MSAYSSPEREPDRSTASGWRGHWRRRRRIGAGLLLGPVVFVVGLAVSTAGTPSAQAGRALPVSARQAPALPEVLVVGDSLAVGLRQYLGEMLPDRALRFSVRHGRTTPDGLEALHHELERRSPQTVVISLGTNDGSSATTFSERIRRALHAIPASACVVWTAVIRPPRKGAYEGLNRALRSEARRDHRLTVVNWDRMVSKGTVKLPDGVHPDAEGFRFRSWVIAAAVRRGCDGEPEPEEAQPARLAPGDSV